MKRQAFEQLVTEAIRELPPIARAPMENVAFVVEEEVRAAKANEMHLAKNQLLLGLYEGIPKTKRGSGYFGVMPDKITIFQQPIEMLANGDPQKLKAIIIDVVRHEFGHHLGYNEPDIRAHEAKRKQALYGADADTIIE